MKNLYIALIVLSVTLFVFIGLKSHHEQPTTEETRPIVAENNLLTVVQKDDIDTGSWTVPVILYKDIHGTCYLVLGTSTSRVLLSNTYECPK